MNVIKAGGEALGGCQQDDCWVACREGTSRLRPARVEMQLLLFLGEMEGAGEKEYENVGVLTCELRIRVC